MNTTLPATYHFATHVDKWRYMEHCFIQRLQEHFINFHNAALIILYPIGTVKLTKQLKMASYSVKNLMCKFRDAKDERNKCQGKKREIQVQQ